MKHYIFALTLALLMAGCSRQSLRPEATAQAKSPETMEVTTAVAEQKIIEKAISVTGSLHPDETVTVSSEVPGRVSRVLVDFGNSVRKGQAVAELDAREYEWQLDRAKASLAQALARLGLSPGEEDKPPQSTSAMRQMEAQMEDARSKYDNAAKLVKSGDISQERFTEMEKAYLARKAALDLARDEMRTVMAGIQALKAEIKLAEKRRNDTVVRAPFDGVVGQRMVSPGQYVRDNAPFMTIVKTSPLRLRLEVPETASAAVREGTVLTFTTDALPGKQFHAVVRELNPMLDSRNRSLTAEARLASQEGRLRPGMFVQVRLVTAPRTEVVAVPKEAIYQVAGLNKVFTIDGGKAKEHRLVPGQEIGGGWIELPGGEVKAGERVATSKLPMLTEGMMVRQ